MPSYSILVVDDEQPMLDIIQRVLTEAGHRVVTASNGREVGEILAQVRVDLVMTDLLMPERDGTEVIAELRKTHPSTPIVAMSGGGRMPRGEYLKIAKLFGAHAILEKPFTNEQLLSTIELLVPDQKAATRSGLGPR
ncbi:MAG TPA: response regulator [Opitutaceae bacterium]|nr:response regulator [Opitutaceae bacterium]